MSLPSTSAGPEFLDHISGHFQEPRGVAVPGRGDKPMTLDLHGGPQHYSELVSGVR